MTTPSQPTQEPHDTLLSVGAMSLVDHLQELRRRIIICLIAVTLTSTVSYFCAENLVKIIAAPAGKLYFINPAEVFFTYLKVSFFTGFLAALPVVLYQLWAFVVPALTKTERSLSFLLTPSSVVLFFVGILFSYFFVLPAGIRFFLSFATESLQPMFSLGEYLSFVISFLLPFGFIFELPLFILVLAKMGIINSAFLSRKRKVVLVLAFVVGAFISPTPDVFSQTMIAVPMILLYEISILMVKYLLRK
ncbi:sec-independent periplasmic protein translocase tatc [Lucifera butyrica]|uniref:Sec-independent protein translocase protein TatC n=1 Tax=Lucifera butyrica TaxID=1351585 RepID=A0A498R2F5_9FIRM|nr:twin-arginine translocase subunit TatC [Lucifera butyrica]VBB04950.1 sec-independent periplasmic protein translocase tatc [Lucifera butyrica]